MLTLTPGYDICPQARAGNEASQAMLIVGDERASKLALCLKAAPNFLLNEQQATEIIQAQIDTICEQFDAVCEEASLSKVERDLLAGRQFLNPSIFEGAPEGLQSLWLDELFPRAREVENQF